MARTGVCSRLSNCSPTWDERLPGSRTVPRFAKREAILARSGTRSRHRETINSSIPTKTSRSFDEGSNMRFRYVPIFLSPDQVLYEYWGKDGYVRPTVDLL